jgi:hypothetical protein
MIHDQLGEYDVKFHGHRSTRIEADHAITLFRLKIWPKNMGPKKPLNIRWAYGPDTASKINPTKETK